MKSLSFLLIILLFTSCGSNKTDKELFDEAQKNLKQDKIPEAVMAFEELINEYSESKLAPEALSQLAAIYQGKRVKSLSEEENCKKAVVFFKQIHDEYPENDYAPTGLFMAGFIYANELKNYNDATVLFKQFLNEYPNHDLAASAQAELDNMGLSPEEILEKTLANENK